MKCPLFTVGGYTADLLPRYGFNDCLKSECAWWEDTIGKCSIRRIWIALQDIHEVLHCVAKTLNERR